MIGGNGFGNGESIMDDMGFWFLSLPLSSWTSSETVNSPFFISNFLMLFIECVSAFCQKVLPQSVQNHCDIAHSTEFCEEENYLVSFFLGYIFNSKNTSVLLVAKLKVHLKTNGKTFCKCSVVSIYFLSSLFIYGEPIHHFHWWTHT